LSGYHIADNKYRAIPILNVEKESATVKTFTFKDKTCAKAKPGQFLMLWIPGVDEIPFSILNARKNGTVSVAVRRVGEATKALHHKEVGEIIGVRGPFGNSFSMKGKRVLLVGGGTGIAPLLFLTNKMATRARRLIFVIGAKTRGELLFLDDIEKACTEKGVVAATEDGSYGIKCLATEPAESLLAKKEFDMIYTCGPERMMRKIFDLAEKHETPIEASLERLMRCAIGLCGSCVIGKYRVCRDGPVFNRERLREVVAEFGKRKRDFDGKEIPLE